MLLGVVSDSHDNLESVRAARRELERRGVGALIHLGDFTSPFTFRELFRGWSGKAFAVAGNNDGDQLLLSKQADALGVVFTNHPQVLELEGRRLLLLHGMGRPELTLEVVRAIASGGTFDGVLFGHTHSPLVEKSSRSLLLNPGELAGCLTGKKTVALLDLESMTAEIIEV
ncbi:MAG: YfcE family phosphodiesterase [Fervidicoccaceae archaeon]